MMSRRVNRNKSRVIAGIGIAAMLCCMGCGSTGNGNTTTKTTEEPVTVVEATAAAAQAEKLASEEYAMSGNGIENFDLFFLKTENKEENMIYSPLSVKYALAMLNEGAGGRTKEQITAALGSYVPTKYENTSHMAFANALFVKDTLKSAFNESYTSTVSSKYNANVALDSFESADNINSWVKQNTLGLVDNITSDDELKKINNLQFTLINALAIDMDWDKSSLQARWINEESENGRPSATLTGYSYKVRFWETIYSAYIPSPGDGASQFEKILFGDDQIEVSAAQIGATINKYDIVNVIGEDSIRETVGNAFDEWMKKENSEYLLKAYSATLDKEEALYKYIKELDRLYGTVAISTDFEFYTDDTVKVFAKDLKEENGTTLQYVGIMPTTESLSEYISETDSSKLTSLVNKLITLDADNFDEGYVYRISGHIPFFKYEYELNLKSDLEKMGITDVFDSTKSNLSNMVCEDSYINQTEHKATIEFTNEGIRAAATTRENGKGSANFDLYEYDLPVKEIDLTFDKPYMYLIRNKETGEIWFVGTVYNPEADATMQ